MYDAMDRSAVKALKRRKFKIDAIAEQLGMNRKTVMTILNEPEVRELQKRERASQVDPFREQIRGWIKKDTPVKRMLELAQEDTEKPYKGGRSEFYAQVAELRREVKRELQEAIVRFEGVPGEYCQIDWGEVRNFPFLQQPAQTRYFFAARLKFSRVSYVEFTTDMKLETLVRCMIRAFEHFGGVPWVCVFDNMKTVTSGRDIHGKPIWNPTFLKVVFELETHPEACWPASGNQKGSVENLVGWVKSNFLPERSFLDDQDLTRQCGTWLDKANSSVSRAHEAIPAEVLERHEKGELTPLKVTAREYGLATEAKVSPESFVHVDSNRYSVPVGHIGRSVLVRIRQDWIDVYWEAQLVAHHTRARQHQVRPIRIPEHYEPVFAKKPRAQVMLYRDHLTEQDPSIFSYICKLCNRFRGTFGPHILKMYELLQAHGADQLGAACAIAGEHDAYGAEYLESLLRQPREVPVQACLPVSAPSQAEVDRHLAFYDGLAHESGW